MNLAPDPIAVTLQVTHALEDLQVPYLVVGSLASAYYGVSRSSLDSDIVVDLKPEQVPTLAQKLGSDFYVDERMAQEAVRRQGSFNLIHRPTMFKVDVFIAKQRPFDRAQLERRRALKFDAEGKQTAFLASAEDTILAKLEWYRLGDQISDRQWQDILGILKVQKGRLDFVLLRDWAVQIGVADLLERATAEAKRNG